MYLQPCTHCSNLLSALTRPVQTSALCIYMHSHAHCPHLLPECRYIVMPTAPLFSTQCNLTKMPPAQLCVLHAPVLTGPLPTSTPCTYRHSITHYPSLFSACTWTHMSTANLCLLNIHAHTHTHMHTLPTSALHVPALTGPLPNRACCIYLHSRVNYPPLFSAGT